MTACREISECRSCGSRFLHDVLSLGELHVSAFVDIGESIPKYPLELVLCKTCSLVQLRHTVPPEEMYRNYWYRSGTNRSMTIELQGIAKEASSRQQLESGDIVLDIGCNDGTLLRSYSSTTFTVGFEPAKNLVPFAEDGADMIINDFFNAAAWKREMGTARAKVVTSIAMFYDLDDPNSFVRDVHEVLSDDGLWIVQMADLKSMLDRTMWDNICHEHLEYYSLTALEILLHRHGFYVEDLELNAVNGGSLRAYIRKNVRPDSGWSTPAVTTLRQAEQQMGLETSAPYEAFAQRVKEESAKLVAFVQDAVANDKRIYVYGASTKGNTLLQYTGIGRHLLAAAERNSDKWGKYTVGSMIPIVSEEYARNARPDYMLVLPWHFMDEFLEREAEYLKRGGAFIVPLPTFRVIRAT